jgi:hypothetical protein
MNPKAAVIVSMMQLCYTLFFSSIGLPQLGLIESHSFRSWSIRELHVSVQRRKINSPHH